MAHPDCDDGWFKYAHELDAAVVVADFTKAEGIVLREVRVQLFFPSLQKTARLSPTDIGRRSGTNRVNISEAITSLVENHVLVEAETGHRFIKDYERWTRNGKPRLSPTEIVYCLSANQDIKQSNPRKKRSQPTTDNVVNGLQLEPKECSQRTTLTVVNGLHPCSQPTTDNVVNGLHSDGSRSIGTRRELEIGDFNTDVLEVADAHATPAYSSNAWPDGIDPNAPNVLTPQERAIIDAATNLCDVLYPMREEIKRVVIQRTGRYPVEWYGLALRAMEEQPRNKWNRGYLLAILKGYRENGPPEVVKPFQADGRANGKRDDSDPLLGPVEMPPGFPRPDPRTGMSTPLFDLPLPKPKARP